MALQPVLEEDLAAAPLQRPTLVLALLALVAGNIALSLGALLVRYSDAGPVSTGFWRVFLPLPLFFLLAHRGGFRLSETPRKTILLALLAGSFFGLDIISWHLGIFLTKLGNATLFGNFASIMLVVYSIIVARALPGRWQGLALLLAMAGSALLMGQSLELSHKNLVGDLLSLTAGILYCGYLLGMMRVRATTENWGALGVSSGASAVVMLIGAIIAGEQFWPGNWWPLITLAITSQIIGHGCLTYALPHFSPIIIGLALLLQPAIAATSGWALFGEGMSGLDWIGSAMVMLALVLARLQDRPIQPKQAA